MRETANEKAVEDGAKPPNSYTIIAAINLNSLKHEGAKRRREEELGIRSE